MAELFQLVLGTIPITTEQPYQPTATSLLSLLITDYTHLDSFTLVMRGCQMVKISNVQYPLLTFTDK